MKFLVYCNGLSSFFSSRFDECNVSPLTIKALSLAGYVQMTKVQEATISACLEGMNRICDFFFYVSRYLSILQTYTVLNSVS